jgi:hypothetical protein
MLLQGKPCNLSSSDITDAISNAHNGRTVSYRRDNSSYPFNPASYRRIATFFIKPKPKILLSLISKDSEVILQFDGKVNGRRETKIFMLEVENKGRLCGDASDVKVHAIFEGKRECALLWDYPVEWGQEWKFAGSDAKDCLLKGLEPHIGGFESQEAKRINKNEKVRFLLFFTIENENQARVTSIPPNALILLDIPRTYRIQVFIKGKDRQGDSFITAPRTFNLKLNSWKDCVLEEAK